MALFRIYELLSSKIITWEIYEARINLAFKTVEHAESLLHFLETAVYLLSEFHHETELIDHTESATCQPARLLQLSESVWLQLTKDENEPKGNSNT